MEWRVEWKVTTGIMLTTTKHILLCTSCQILGLLERQLQQNKAWRICFLFATQSWSRRVPSKGNTEYRNYLQLMPHLCLMCTRGLSFNYWLGVIMTASSMRTEKPPSKNIAQVGN